MQVKGLSEAGGVVRARSGWLRWKHDKKHDMTTALLRMFDIGFRKPEWDDPHPSLSLEGSVWRMWVLSGGTVKYTKGNIYIKHSLSTVWSHF